MKRLQRFFALVALMLLMSAITSFGDSTDINNKLIATTIAVDKRDGEIWFYVEFANIQAVQGSSGGGGGGGGAKKYVLVTSHGRTLAETRSNLNRQLDMPLYISGVRTLLLTENFAKDHLLEYLYRLRADETYRKKVITTVTRDSMDEMFKTLNDKNESLGYSIEHTIQTLEASGECIARTTSRLLENLSDKYTGILLPCVGLQSAEVALTGYSVVNDAEVIGFIPIEACKGLNMLKTDHAKSFYVIPFKGDYYTLETMLTKRHTATTYVDGRPHFTISLDFDATLEYGDRKTPYNFKDEDKRAMTDTLKSLILQDVSDAIIQAQNTFRTDYLQLDDAFRVTYPVLAEEMDWSDGFASAVITPDIEVKLSTASMIDYGTDVSR